MNLNLSFDQVANFYSQSRRPLPAFVYDFVGSRIRQQQTYCDYQPIRYVDLATGTGLLVRNIPRLPNVDITAVDVSLKMLENARLRYANNIVRYIHGDVHDLPFANESVDAASCCQSIHLFSPDRFYPEINRILAPHGILIIITYDLIASANSPARFTNEIFQTILAHETWSGFSETGIHPTLLQQLEQYGLIPFETISKETIFSFRADEWQRRIESSSLTLKIPSDSVRQAVLDEHVLRIRHFFGDQTIQQRQRCWIVLACREEFINLNMPT